jgi:hypothetical protein
MDPAPRLHISPPPPGRDAVGAWLDTLGALLRMPAAKRAAIRDELENHLRERVRDLMLSGTPEPEAARAAIAELGDAVRLAERLRAAGRAPARRLAMHVALFGMAGAALVTSFVAMQGGPQVAAEGPKAAIHRQEAPQLLAQVMATAAAQPAAGPKVSIRPHITVDELMKQVIEGAGMPVIVRWKTLEDMNMGPGVNLEVDGELKGIPLAEAFANINRASGLEDNGLDFRLENGRLTVASIEAFDRAELTVVTYDLSPQDEDRARMSLNESLPQTTEKVLEDAIGVVQSMVHPTCWQSNGGDRAYISNYGPKLFVRAPKRFHPEIAWVIEQLPTSTARASAPLLDDVPLLGTLRTERASTAVIGRLLSDQAVEKNAAGK